MGLSEKYINFLNHPTVEATIDFIKKFKSSKSYWSVSYFILLFTIREAIAWKFGSAIKTFCEAQTVDSSFPMLWSVLGFVFDVGGSIELVLLGTFIFVLLSFVKVAESEGTSISVRENYLTLFLIVFVGSISFFQSSETLTIVEDTNKAIKEIQQEQNESKHLRNDLEREREKYAKLEKEFYALRKSVKELVLNDTEIINNANQKLEDEGLEPAIFYLKQQLSVLSHAQENAYIEKVAKNLLQEKDKNNIEKVYREEISQIALVEKKKMIFKTDDLVSEPTLPPPNEYCKTIEYMNQSASTLHITSVYDNIFNIEANRMMDESANLLQDVVKTNCKNIANSKGVKFGFEYDALRQTCMCAYGEKREVF